jgi:hypothetical protein
MTYIITYLIIGVFLSLLFLNLYFRIKVFKVYKVLVQNRIEFNSSHIFNKDKMEKEVLSRYPTFKSEILSFTGHIKKSILIAIILVLLITIMGIILKNI